MNNDILMYTIANGTHKSKQEWIEDFKIIGIDVPHHVLDYDFNKDTKETKYYNNNKDKINKKMNCKCGGKYTKKNITIHQKTKKHQQYLQNLSSSLVLSSSSSSAV